jgi:hypothetical protein
MINIDQPQVGKMLVPIHVVLLQSFASIPHQWQMMGRPVGQRGTRNSKIMVGIAAPVYLLIQDMDYDSCPSSVALTPFITSDK